MAAKRKTGKESLARILVKGTGNSIWFTAKAPFTAGWWVSKKGVKATGWLAKKGTKAGSWLGKKGIKASAVAGAWAGKKTASAMKRLIKSPYVRSAGAGVIVYQFPGTTIKLILTGVKWSAIGAYTFPGVVIPAALGAGTYHYFKDARRRKVIWQLVSAGKDLAWERIGGKLFIKGGDGKNRFRWSPTELIVLATERARKGIAGRRETREARQRLLKALDEPSMKKFVSGIRKEIEAIHSRAARKAKAVSGQSIVDGAEVLNETRKIKAIFTGKFERKTGIKLSERQVDEILSG